jgi:ubiquinone/menaquinone biosynthesis C-methylase UbiE
LRRLLGSIDAGAEVLEYGCGVGRWTLPILRRAATVLGIDFSEVMLNHARARIDAAGFASACRLIRADVTTLSLEQRFDLVFGVTVLQHVAGDELAARAVARLAGHLKPGGRLVMLEVAPQASDARTDTATFHARTLASYVGYLRAAGLSIEEIRGVDPMPFKRWVIPRFIRWPRPIALAALVVATALSLPLDLLLARRWCHRSWHKIIVAKAPEGSR